MIWLGVAMAGTLSVPSQHPTLQAALTAAVTGDTIEVDPSYAPGSAVVTVSTSVTIKGLNGGAQVDPLAVTVDAELIDVVIAQADTHLELKSGHLTGTNVRFTTSSRTKLTQSGGELALDQLLLDSHIVDNVATWAMHISGGTASFTDCRFEGNDGIGGVWVQGGDLTLEDCELVGNSATAGLFLLWTNASLTLKRVHAKGNTSEDDATAAVATMRGGALHIERSRFEGNSSSTDGGDLLVEGGKLTVDYLEAVESSAPRGSFLASSGGQISLKEVRFVRSRPTTSGVIFQSGSAPLAVRRSHFCNTQLQEGLATSSAFEIHQTGSSNLTLTNVIIGGASGNGRASVISNTAGTLQVEHLTASGGSASTLLLGVAPVLIFKNDLVVDYGTGMSFEVVTSLTGSHNLFFDVGKVSETNSGSILLGDPDSLYGDDPSFVGWDPTDCESLPELASDSPAIGAGREPDDSPSDIGALGGPDGEGLLTWRFDGGGGQDTGHTDDTGDTGYTEDTGHIGDSGHTGAPDSSPDTGPPKDSDPGPSWSLGTASGGCAVGAGSGGALALFGLALAARRRRRPSDSGRLDPDA